MHLLDANLLLYVANQTAPEHQAARDWFEERMNSGQRVALPWHSLMGFLRIATGPTTAMSMDDALAYVDEWLEWHAVWVPEPTVSHMRIVGDLLRPVPKSHLVPDAHLAALAIEHGLILCSNDTDFRLFKGLSLHNPLDP